MLLKVGSSFFVFNGMIQTIFTVLMKMPMVCTGMLSTETDNFKFLKVASCAP